MFDDIPRPTCRSVYTVSDKRLRHGGSGYETNDDSCANDRESQDIECEECDSFQEARGKKNTFERNRYKANSVSKKDSMKAYYVTS